MPDLLLSYYGDDLTGSTDVMEALSLGGVPTVLFMGSRTRRCSPGSRIAARSGWRARRAARRREWMDTHLAPAFRWLKGLNAALCHYKVCSTFDSSPDDRQHRPRDRDRPARSSARRRCRWSSARRS